MKVQNEFFLFFYSKTKNHNHHKMMVMIYLLTCSQLFKLTAIASY